MDLRGKKWLEARKNCMRTFTNINKRITPRSVRWADM
jgi:hypothetical protein